MTDQECVALLQRILPRMGLRWRGFKNVRRQVVRRIVARIRELGVDAREYEEMLGRSDEERRVFDSLCYVTISRFYRDRQVYDDLRERLAARRGRGDGVRIWSAGCACGEEPYTLAILAAMMDVPLQIIATDFNDVVLARAREGIYEAGSFRELPEEWRDQAFEAVAHDHNHNHNHEHIRFRVRERFRKDITFLREDIRRYLPSAPIDIVLCRNLAFTYFSEEAQQAFLNRVVTILAPDALLVVGAHEALPPTERRFTPIAPHIYSLAPTESLRAEGIDR